MALKECLCGQEERKLLPYTPEHVHEPCTPRKQLHSDEQFTVTSVSVSAHERDRNTEIGTEGQGQRQTGTETQR